MNGVDPFSFCTITSVCMGVFRYLNLEETLDVRLKEEQNVWREGRKMGNGKVRVQKNIYLFVYLFGVLRRFQHYTGHITTGSWKGRGNQYIEFVRVQYCKLPTNGKQLPAFPLEAVTEIEPRPQRWEARVLQKNNTWCKIVDDVAETKFVKSPIAVIPNGGYAGGDNFSQVSIQIQGKMNHALNGGEVKVQKQGGGFYKLDGYYVNETGRQVAMEFLGCGWHGCPVCYSKDAIHPFFNQKLGERYTQTEQKK